MQPDIPDILCIGSVLWDIIGRTPTALRSGDDVPGRIVQSPGGVALNIAATLARFGMRPAVLSAVGRDPAGEALLAACRALWIDTDPVWREGGLPTDRYMAIEGAGGLIAALADAHALEAAGAAILQPLADGRLGSAAAPWAGPVAIDGNLTEALLAEIADSPLFAAADLRLAPASPGKATRLTPLLAHPRATFYVNLAEASILCGTDFDGAQAAAEGLLRRGAQRVLVTDGGRDCAEAGRLGQRHLAPPPVRVARVTGAGDTFMAAHIAAEHRGADPAGALAQAVQAAALHVAEASV